MTAPLLSPEPQIRVLHYLTALEHPLTSQNLGEKYYKRLKHQRDFIWPE